jgi:flagellar motility protein MotE (MotC chaperone)
MKSGYDQFFKNARKAAEVETSSFVSRKKPARRTKIDLSAEDIDQQIRRRMSLPATAPKKKRKPFPFKLVFFLFVGVIGAFWGLENHIEVERMLKRVEVTMTGEALAEDIKSPSASSATKSAGEAGEPSKSEISSGDLPENENYLSKLNERKKELDAREEELNRQDAELQAQKTELDKRFKELEEMRNKISSILEERVKSDDQKVDTLVQLYSNMKPPQAAKIFETMDEDLVVDILGRMKKKSAADIMNLLKAEKAQIISEKYAGYKSR